VALDLQVLLDVPLVELLAGAGDVRHETREEHLEAAVGREGEGAQGVGDGDERRCRFWGGIGGG